MPQVGFQANHLEMVLHLVNQAIDDLSSVFSAPLYIIEDSLSHISLSPIALVQLKLSSDKISRFAPYDWKCTCFLLS